MPPRKPKKFCRLTKFLELTDKDLYQAMDDLCLFSLFRTRGTRGVTFLYPTDKAYRKKIIDMAYSNTPEKAVDMIKALVLMDYLPKPTDFKNKKDDIPNALRKRLEVEDADAKSVQLKDGLKLVLDESFISMRSDDHVAVYKLSGKGMLSTTGASSGMKYSQGNTKGGYYGGDDIFDYKRTLSNFVESTYIKDTQYGKNVYKFVLAFLFRKATQSNDKQLQQNIYNGLCASDRASYYNILRPHSSENPYFINLTIYELLAKLGDETWNEARNNKKLFIDSKDELINAVRPTNYNLQAKRDENYKLQMLALQTSKNPMEYMEYVINAYNGRDQELAKDLLTIYCYLSSIRESEEFGDNSYYNGCFLPVIQTVFNTSKVILERNMDIAYTLSMYGNLLKSDAYNFEPITSMDPPDSRYPDLRNTLPEPTESRGLFTIVRNSTMAVMGGGIDSEIQELIGGRLYTELETGM
jgi:hypothetical protein